LKIGCLTIRDAIPDEASYLSDLSMRSKAYWGYSTEFMQSCANELVINKTDIENSENHYVVALLDTKVVGYYSLEVIAKSEIELSALFVEPEHIGSGIGYLLILNAKNLALNLGAQKIIIQGDPNAEKFYRSIGGKKIGSKESESIPGRFLPLFEINLINSNRESH